MPISPAFRRRPVIEVRDLGYGRPAAPADPDAVPSLTRRRNAQGRMPRRPHGDATVQAVQRLIEQTTLTYDVISARSGVGRATISRWARDLNWTRPFDAPRATDRMPTWRASQRRKLRTLAERLRLLAERHILELENAATIDAGQLAQALELLKLAKLHAQGRRRHAARKRDADALPRIDRDNPDERSRIDAALGALRACGIDPGKVPNAAMEMVVEANLPPMGAAFGERGRRRR